MSSAKASPEQVIDRLWEIVPPLWHQMRANVRAVASERFQISVLQFRVLRHIRAGTDSASELAAICQTSRPAVSQCIDALVAKGLVTRQRSTRDRRCQVLEVTPSGRELLDAVFAENRRWMMRRLAPLSSGELECILSGLRVLQSSFLP